jgi:thiol:disulfide interchange protein DsbD
MIERSMMKVILAIGLAWTLCAVSAAGAGTRHLTAELLADTTAVAAGRPFTVGLLLHIDDGWHVYWINPGDAGGPTTLKLTLPPGFTVGPVQYPVPEILPQPGGLTVYAYEKEVMLMATVTPPNDLKGVASVPITAAAGWCVCTTEVCILGKQRLDLTLPVAGDAPAAKRAAANGAVFAAWRERLPLAARDVFSSVQTQGTVNFTWKAGPPASELQWIPGPSDDLTVKAAGIRTVGKITNLSLDIEPIQGIAATSSTISGILAYHGAGGQPGGVAVTLDRQTMELASEGR